MMEMLLKTLMKMSCGSDSLDPESVPLDTDEDGTCDELDNDDDGDGILDTEDVFPLDETENTDTDNDGTGDNADTDDDGDAFEDTDEESCGSDSLDPESVPLDTDEDGTCDELDNDDDGDGILDTEDVFPLDETENTDTDNDGTGDNADTDDDGDAFEDTDEESCGSDSLDPESVPLDTDEDGTCDELDNDDDGDGILDTEDVFPLDATEDTDTDGDGTGDNADTDDDGDGTPDTEDAFPLDETENTDTDGDGTGDNADTDDDDGDGTPDTEDAFPLDETENTDRDNDGTGDNADTDDDGDGTPDTEDAFPLDETENTDTDGDGTGDNADTDDDGDGTPDTEDAFPLDETENTDTDGDGVGDNADNCLDEANLNQEDEDSDGVGDACSGELQPQVPVDTDGDGILDEDDVFPLFSDEDGDRDNDGISDLQDNCPEDMNSRQTDFDRDGIGDFCEESANDILIEIQRLPMQTYNLSLDRESNINLYGYEDGRAFQLLFEFNGGPGLVFIKNDGAEHLWSGGATGYVDRDRSSGLMSFNSGVSVPFYESLGEGVHVGSFMFRDRVLVEDYQITVLDEESYNLIDYDDDTVLDDLDLDGNRNYSDNCVGVFNPSQSDFDNDGKGDVCDNDRDGDGVLDFRENGVLFDICPFTSEEVRNVNLLGCSDEDEDSFMDNDIILFSELVSLNRGGMTHVIDNCFRVSNISQSDTDFDGEGDLCDSDTQFIWGINPGKYLGFGFIPFFDDVVSDESVIMSSGRHMYHNEARGVSGGSSQRGFQLDNTNRREDDDYYYSDLDYQIDEREREADEQVQSDFEDQLDMSNAELQEIQDKGGTVYYDSWDFEYSQDGSEAQRHNYNATIVTFDRYADQYGGLDHKSSEKNIDVIEGRGGYTEDQADHLRDIVKGMKDGKTKDIKEKAFYKAGG